MTTKRAKYQQLQPEDRVTIASLCQQKLGVRAIARVLGRAPSTVSRELARNGRSADSYTSVLAHQTCCIRRYAARPQPKLAPDGMCWLAVVTMLLWHQRSNQNGKRELLNYQIRYF